MAGQLSLDPALEKTSRNGPCPALGKGSEIGLRSISGKCFRNGSRANYRYGSRKGL